MDNCDQDIDSYVQGLVERTKAREERLRKLNSIRKEQQENDEEEIRIQQAKRQASLEKQKDFSKSPSKALFSTQNSLNKNISSNILVKTSTIAFNKSPIKATENTFIKKVEDSPVKSVLTSSKIVIPSPIKNASSIKTDTSVNSSIPNSPKRISVPSLNKRLGNFSPTEKEIKKTISFTKLFNPENQPVFSEKFKAKRDLFEKSNFNQESNFTPEKLCVLDKKKIFENAIKKETEKAKRNYEQKIFLSKNKGSDQVSSNPPALSPLYKKQKIFCNELNIEKSNSYNIEFTANLSSTNLNQNQQSSSSVDFVPPAMPIIETYDDKIKNILDEIVDEVHNETCEKLNEDDHMEIQNIITKNSNNQTSTEQIFENNEEPMIIDKIDKKVENESHKIKNNFNNRNEIFKNKQTHFLKMKEKLEKKIIGYNSESEEDDNDTISEDIHDNKPISENQYEKKEDCVSKEKEKEDLIEKKDGNYKRLYCDFSKMEEFESDIEDNKKNPIISNVNKEVKHITPIRTLSMYRREQKMRAANNFTPTKKQNLINKENEEKCIKLQEYKENLRSKMIFLKNEIEKHDNVIAQTSNAISICLKSSEFRCSIEQLEAEKILLITTQKRLACLKEIDIIKEKMNSDTLLSFSFATGCLVIKKIVIPLKGDFIVGQISDQDPLNHHFICLARCGENVLTTEMLNSADSIQEASIFFQNKMEFKNLDSHFEIVFEVYGLALPKERIHQDRKSLLKSTAKLAPRSPKLKQKKTDFKSINYSNENGFSRLGLIKFNMKNICKDQFDFDEFINNSPFNGYCQAEFNLYANYNVELKEYLNFFDETSSYSVWNRRWCVIKGYLLEYWRFAEDETNKPSIGNIDLRNCISEKISPVSYDICARRNTFMIVSLLPKDKNPSNKSTKNMYLKKFLISADLDEEMELWCSKLNKLLENIRIWEKNALKPTNLDNKILSKI